MSVDGSDPLLLINQSGEQGLKLHNNLLSSSGGTVYLAKSSQGCRIYFVFCCLACIFSVFFFHFLMTACLFYFIFFCFNPVIKPQYVGKELVTLV